MKYFYITVTFILISIQLLFSQAPANYYNGTDGLTGNVLRAKLSMIIDGHNSQSYNSLWQHFKTTDKKTNGKVWDMYSIREDGSANYQYTFGDDQCGNYSGEGSCYNREHSFPKSWFGNNSPMKTDLFHLYPTDGYTNGRRGNYPFGEVGSATWTSTNGSKVGPSNYPGYSGTVFEPIDEFKGDFARTYFYMLTRYYNNISSWNSAMLSGNNFSTWAKDMLIEWHQADPVSQKEIDRNNAVYNIQNNRNPYIDHPEWAIAVWKPEIMYVEEVKEQVQVWYASGHVYWSNNTKVESLEIYNILGQKVEESNHLDGTRIFTDNLIPGVYLAKVQSKKTYLVKFIVTQ